MKRVAVLACGPSLAKLYKPSNRADYDVVIGVNTAGWLYTVDWLAFADTHIVEPIVRGEYPPPMKGWITNGGQANRVRAHWPDLPTVPLPLTDRDLGNITPAMDEIGKREGRDVCAWTFPNALHVAQTLAAGGRIDVFGFDCAMQQKDVAGQDGYHTRKRWLMELPWIRTQWGPNVLPVCCAHRTILSWLAGDGATWEDVEALFPGEPAGTVNMIEHRRQ